MDDNASPGPKLGHWLGCTKRKEGRGQPGWSIKETWIWPNVPKKNRKAFFFLILISSSELDFDNFYA
jgi:hypothetical protein